MFPRSVRWLPISIAALIACQINSAWASPTIVDKTLVSATRTGRTTYSYSYTITVKNDATALQNVTATVTSGVASTVVLQNKVTFASLAANSTATSTSTFTISQDRTVAFNPAALSWTFTGTIVNNHPAQFVPATDVIVKTETVDAFGKVLTMQNTGTALDGVTVKVPAGALAKATAFSIGYNPATPTVSNGAYGGAVLYISAGTTKNFSQPVLINAPFRGDSTQIPVPYYIDPNGKFHLAQILSVNRSTHSFTFQTDHASWYTWIIAHIPGISDSFDTGYKPGTDGFQIRNEATIFTRPGECLGMTSFSQWFFENKKGAEGNFFPKYMSLIPSATGGTALRGQQVIATRSYISIARDWDVYIPMVQAQQNLTAAEQVASIESALLNTNNPVLIYLYGGNIGTHSVLAYGFDSASTAAVAFHVYDPNYPRDTSRAIVYNALTGIAPYDGHTGAVYNGDGSMYLEPYTHILADADQNFQNNTGSTITITSDTSGEIVTSRNINLVGRIASGQVLADTLTVFVGSTSYTVSVGLDGAFSIPIVLLSGLNHLQFVTFGKDFASNPVQLSSNLDASDFTITADIPTAEILMTLTWGTNDTDLDTYVIDPTGDYSAYYHRMTASGGTLDHDVTTGFGPEHWTLRTTDTIQYDSPYHFRVHYYSDHGNGPSNYTVTLEFFQGTPQDVIYTYSGNLSVSNPGNAAPNSQGPDWVDIGAFVITRSGTVSPANSSSTSPAARLSTPTAIPHVIKLQSTPNTPIRINAPIPSASERLKTH